MFCKTGVQYSQTGTSGRTCNYFHLLQGNLKFKLPSKVLYCNNKR